MQIHALPLDAMVAGMPHFSHVADCSSGSCLPPPLHAVLKPEKVAPNPHEDPLHLEPLSSTEADAEVPHFVQVNV
jgi:hypothetical protein